MKRLFAAVFFMACLPGTTFAEAPMDEGKHSPAYAIMTSTTRNLLQSLDANQRDQILFPFADAERFDWHFVPRARRGLPLQAMSAAQQAAVKDLLGAALSHQGAAKVENILLIEGILDEIESARRPGRTGFRDPEMYFLTLFGEPSDDEPWGWRFEGHHLSLNFSTVTGLVAGTPAFYGANPAEVPEGFGDRSGLRTLADEEDLGRKLINALDGGQKEQAIFSSTAPRDIITGASREVSLENPVGLAFAGMSEQQQKILRQIVSVYVDNLDTEIAADYWRRIEDRGWDHVHFGWAGGTEKGQGHYYRVQGPTFLIEYDNVQNNANHVHSVLRDLENDWGHDFLRRHYERHEHPLSPPP